MSEHNEPSSPTNGPRNALDGRTRSARWWRRATVTLLALGVGVPFAADALGPVPHTFAGGEVISASEINANFAYLQNAITTVEGQVPPTTCGTGQIMAFDGSDWICADRTPPGTTTYGSVTFKCSEGGTTFEDRGAWCYADGGHVCTVLELNVINHGGYPASGCGSGGHAWTEHPVAGFNEVGDGNVGAATAWIWRSDYTLHAGAGRLAEGWGVYCCY